MKQVLVERLMHFTVLADKLREQCFSLYQSSFYDDLEGLNFNFQNRERMIADIMKYREEFMKQRNEIPSEVFTALFDDLGRLSRLIARIDEELISVLQFQKLKTEESIQELKGTKRKLNKFRKATTTTL